MCNYEEGPVYYREIQKNAYLKRIPTDLNTSKLRPLGHKKAPLKPMWTLFCVHNGRTPFLEQYPEHDSPMTLAHKPAWRACLKTARHVTASVKPHIGEEYDFLVDTDHGPVRMLAPDWDSMQDWVTILRSKLHELRIVSLGQNVYGAPPVAPVARAAARDPTSPLPPTPPQPPDRVPGIELTPITRTTDTNETQSSREDANTNSCPSTTNSTTIPTRSNPTTSTNPTTVNSNPTRSNPTTSTNPTTANTNPTIANSITSNPATATSVITSPGISISTSSNSSTSNAAIATTSTSNTVITSSNTATSTIFQTTHTNLSPVLLISKNLTFSNVSSLTSSLNPNEVDISNWEPFSLPSTSREIEPKKSIKVCGQNICLNDSIFKRDVTDSDEDFFDDVGNTEVQDEVQFKQRVVVNNGENGDESVPQRSNITVIQVSNKGPPHTAIPVLGPETDVFDFEFKQKLQISEETQKSNFVNIVNTESNSNSYGTVFEFEPKPEYGHISLTTTVSLTGDKPVNLTASDRNVYLANNTDYERLCLASTSNRTESPLLAIRKIKKIDKVRKSSLPNLEVDSDYECLFPNANANSNPNNQNSSQNNNNNNTHNNGNIQNGEVSRLRSNVERSQSQNDYDTPRRRVNRVQNESPKREAKTEKPESQPKPIWKRGLTELSLLSRLRGIALTRRQESPTREDERTVTSPAKVVHRSRPAGRVDSSRRRSNSLTNSQSPSMPCNPGLQPLRARQVAALRAEQRRGACIATTVPVRDPPLFCDYERQVWIVRWGISGYRCGGRLGDRLAALAGTQVTSAAHARQLLKAANTPIVDLLFYRVPLGKIYVVNKKDRESLGIKLDNECTITSISAQSPASRVCLPTRGKWTLTEINNRPLQHGKGCEEEMNKLACNGTEVSILIQPAPLVKKMRAANKSGKNLLGIR